MHLHFFPRTLYAFARKEMIAATYHDTLTRSQLRALINEHVFHALDRRILCRKLLDGATFEQIAEEVDRSTNCVKERYRNAFQHLAHFLP